MDRWGDRPAFLGTGQAPVHDMSLEASISEVKRQVAVVEETYLLEFAQKDAIFEYQREARQFSLMMSTLWDFASQLLILGQARWRIDADVAASVRDFVRCKDWLSFAEEAFAGTSAQAGQKQADLLMYRNLLEPWTALVLADDRVSVERLCKAASPALFWSPEKVSKGERSTAAFMRAVIRIVNGERSDLPETSGASVWRTGLPPTEGYERLLVAIDRRDDEMFSSTLAQLSEAYRKRISAKESTLNPWGFGPVAQAATFDALGTALCRIARWHGMAVGTDSNLQPVEFIG